MPAAAAQAPSATPSSTAGVARRGLGSRWWLAGLLVSCLLPAGLSQVETQRLSERIVQVCILAPALMRARCRCVARRRALRRWPPRPLAMPGLLRRPPWRVIPRPRWTAAHDVLTRRGPPGRR
ncbi:hypothetical protein HOP52_08645 [Halomonas campisalis]|uniref:Uncharacterized protein n=1 Tax=Billgrantia campisalis TaxID=74661 RepID=A0ABS9P879_9GAMM|nr:hypothetical protein [Halomonas campisalis]MCG6657821.1 hypothetical protein [Halomonas campisalis]MDR5864707.1 hypothetical protein [Halomonas campisalis]